MSMTEFYHISHTLRMADGNNNLQSLSQ